MRPPSHLSDAIPVSRARYRHIDCVIDISPNTIDDNHRPGETLIGEVYELTKDSSSPSVKTAQPPPHRSGAATSPAPSSAMPAASSSNSTVAHDPSRSRPT